MFGNIRVIVCVCVCARLMAWRWWGSSDLRWRVRAWSDAVSGDGCVRLAAATTSRGSRTGRSGSRARGILSMTRRRAHLRPRTVRRPVPRAATQCVRALVRVCLRAPNACLRRVNSVADRTKFGGVRTYPKVAHAPTAALVYCVRAIIIVPKRARMQVNGEVDVAAVNPVRFPRTARRRTTRAFRSLLASTLLSRRARAFRDGFRSSSGQGQNPRKRGGRGYREFGRSSAPRCLFLDFFSPLTFTKIFFFFKHVSLNNFTGRH